MIFLSLTHAPEPSSTSPFSAPSHLAFLNLIYNLKAYLAKIPLPDTESREII